jgi:hypothetical protein
MRKNVSASKQENLHGRSRPSPVVAEQQNFLGKHVCIQRDSLASSVQANAPALVREVLDTPGQPIDAETRSVMEPRFGYDFSGVRVHTDEAAAISAGAVTANAYTANNHIAFASQKYSPATPNGQSLLAHELTHVVQQARGAVSGTAIGQGLHLSHPEDPFERSAKTIGDDELHGRPLVPNAATLIPLRHPPYVPGDGYIQRDGLFGSQTASSDAGAVAGIVGAGLGAAALGLALFAYLRPPEALNPAPVTGGISINPNPFSFNTLQPTPVPEPPSNRARFTQAQREAPALKKILDLRTDGDNHAELNLALRSDGYNIIGASVQTGATQNYLGGSRGSSATVNFAQTQISPAANIFSAPEPATGAAGQPPTNAATQPSTTGAAGQSQTASGQPAPAGQTSGPAAAQPASERAEVLVSFTGSNAKDQKAPQNFAGDISVKADGTATCTRCEATNGLGMAVADGGVGIVDYRSASGSLTSALHDSESRSTGGGEIERGGGVLPRFDVPNPPIFDRPGGIPE